MDVLHFLIYSAFFLFCYYFYLIFTAKAPRLYAKRGSRLHRLALKRLSFLKNVYYPPWWVQNGTLHTVWRTFQSGPRLPWEREIVTFPDGGIAAVDWLHPKENKEDVPTLILFPGITGHTHASPYLWNPAKDAHEKGWRTMIINRRGLGVPLKTPRIAGSDNSDDVSFILENILMKKYPKGKKLGLGFSMGGMILINYLASRTKENAIIDVGMSVSSPFDGHASSRNMSSFFPKYFLSRMVALNLIATIKPYKDILKDHVDWDWVCAARVIGDFEHRCTAKLNGYKDLNHYYIETGPYAKIEKIPIPFLALTSEDDYFVPIEWMPLEKFEQSETAVCVVTAHGGHTAYMESGDVNASGLVERVFFEWAAMNIDGNE